VTSLFEELDCRRTELGELVLRRRRLLGMGGLEIHEIRLDDEFLMSSLFHEAEVALTKLALGALDGDALDVAVGGLGLGYTAAAALDSERVARLVVIELLQPVIDWHRRGLVPNGSRLATDARCVLHRGDFFELARGEGFDLRAPGHRFDAILVDIDHSPEKLLHPRHAAFYSVEGLNGLRGSLTAGGVFGLWSNDPPQERFLDLLGKVFTSAEGHRIEFANPLQESMSCAGVYIACCGG
jgi:spermidine synthase